MRMIKTNRKPHKLAVFLLISFFVLLPLVVQADSVAEMSFFQGFSYGGGPYTAEYYQNEGDTVFEVNNPSTDVFELMLQVTPPIVGFAGQDFNLNFQVTEDVIDETTVQDLDLDNSKMYVYYGETVNNIILDELPQGAPPNNPPGTAPFYYAITDVNQLFANGITIYAGEGTYSTRDLHIYLQLKLKDNTEAGTYTLTPYTEGVADDELTFIVQEPPSMTREFRELGTPDDQTGASLAATAPSDRANWNATTIGDIYPGEYVDFRVSIKNPTNSPISLTVISQTDSPDINFKDYNGKKGFTCETVASATVPDCASWEE